MSCPVFIYGLMDPFTNQLRYIGKTIQKPYERLSSHCCKTRKKGNRTESWVKSTIQKGAKPEMIIIDEVESSEWMYWEQFYISYYRSIGCNLTNFTEGGDTCNIGRKWKVRDSSRMGGKGRAVILEGVRFRSVKECATHLETTAGSLVKALKGRRTFKGMKVWYEGSSKEIKIVPLPEREVEVRTGTGSFRFETPMKAARELKLDYSSVMKCLRGTLPHAKGYKIKYKNELPEC